MSKYPLDQNDMQEQYEDLLIKAALKEHARKESARLEQEAAGEAAVPPAEDTENEDGTLTLEVVTKSMDSWEGYCNYPTLLTVDFSAGHPVFRSAVVADLTQYWEFPPEPEKPLF